MQVGEQIVCPVLAQSGIKLCAEIPVKKSEKNLTLGFSFVGPEERTQTLIGAGFQSGSTEHSWSPTSGRIAIHTGKTAIPAPFMANVR